MEFTIFDELWLFEMGTQDILIEVIKKLQKHRLVEERLLNVSHDELMNWKPQGSQKVNYAEFFTKVPLWVPDYHGLTEIKDRQQYGCPIPTPAKITKQVNGIEEASKLYLKENGIPHVRNFVDSRRFKVTPNVVNITGNFLSYSKKRNNDGSWSDHPEKKNDHGPDLVHYGSVFNWPNLAYQSFDIEENTNNNAVGSEDIAPATYTGGIMNKIF